ncbi:MAG: cupin [Pseudomonadota bacterium]
MPELVDTFAVLTPTGSAYEEPVTDDLYRRLDKTYNGFAGCALLSCHRFDRDWGVWELHPAGDEIVLLLDGAVTLVLREDGAEREVHLAKPLAYTIVPRDTWHTARTNVATEMVFLTPGEGTRNEVFD